MTRERPAARAPWGVVGVTALCTIACAATGSASRPSTGSTEHTASSQRRRPDGVAVDPPTQTPPPRTRAKTTDGLVALRQPLGSDRALDTLASLFEAVVREDSEGMSKLFTADASVVAAPSGPPVTNAPPLWWDQRFRRLDYGRLAGELVYRPTEVEIVRGDDPDAVGRADGLGDGDVLLRVSVVTTRAGEQRLLGDAMVLWLRRDGDRYRIWRIQEDFQLP